MLTNVKIITISKVSLNIITFLRGLLGYFQNLVSFFSFVNVKQDDSERCTAFQRWAHPLHPLFYLPICLCFYPLYLLLSPHLSANLYINLYLPNLKLPGPKKDLLSLSLYACRLLKTLSSCDTSTSLLDTSRFFCIFNVYCLLLGL